MIYSYRCHKCNAIHDIWQGMKDRHEYVCHGCGERCVRVYQKPQVRRNEGFYSYTLGEWADSHNDFEKKLRRVRYVSGEAERLGDSSKPSDEWVEARVKKEKKKQDMIRRENEKAQMVYHNAQQG